MDVATMAHKTKELDDSLDFTVILTNPSLATTQSLVVAEAIAASPKPDDAQSRAAPAGTSKLNDQFSIGGPRDAGAGGGVYRIRRRSGLAAPLRDAPVLVVDDDLITRKLLERLLMNEGYPVRIAGNKTEFLSAMRLEPQPSLILLDVNMPDMDGFRVLSRLRQHASVSDIPVVLVTARSAPDDVERAFAMGVDGYLSKPVKVGIVRKALNEILRLR